MGASPDWSPTQQSRLDEWRVPRCVDIHCHCLPGVDDGPETTEDAIELCKALVADGVTTVIATPHQLGVYDGYNTAEFIRESLSSFTEELSAAKVPLEIVAGADVRIDERLTKFLESGEVLTPADRGRHLLLELPHQLFVDPLPAIQSLGQSGVQVIMTHPERHRYLVDSVGRIAAWVEAGAVLQLTAGSLVGDFGPIAKQEAWRLVHAGLVSLVATDAHDHKRRPPRLTAALDALAVELDEDAAREMCLINPLRVFEGEPITQPEHGSP
jgi:protein-tyrosine phosphatase